MKVLMINNCYPMKSTGKIVKAIEDSVQKRGYDTAVIYGQGEKSKHTHYRVTSLLYRKLQAFRCRLTGIMYGGCLLSTFKAIRIIRKEKPDIVHLHCLNSNFINIYWIISWLKKNDVKTVITNHAEFYYTANCGHAFECVKYQNGCGDCPRIKKVTKSWFFDGTHRSWIKMKHAFEGFDSLWIVDVSPWLAERSANSVIMSGFVHCTILNGVDTSIFYYRGNYSHSYERIVFHATAHFSDDPDDLKGGCFILDLAKRFEGQNVKFIVAGEYSLSKSVTPNVILLGNLEDQGRLAELYSCADVVVLTSKRETFSMITAESLCCGTPVVGFKAGAPEMIAIPEYSDFVEYGNTELLYRAITKMLDSSPDKISISEVAQKKYSKEKMAEEYIEVYKKCVRE